jgi:hypothetical protein
LVARFLDFSTEDDALDALVLGVKVVDVCKNNRITEKAGAMVVTY